GDAIDAAADRLREIRSEARVFRVDVGEAAARRQFLRHPPAEIGLPSADELVAIVAGEGDEIAGAKGCLNRVGDADVVAIDVITAEGEVEALVEKSALDAVIITFRGFRLEERIGDRADV